MDGKKLRKDIQSIDPSQIDQMNVLKGESAGSQIRPGWKSMVPWRLF